MWSFVNSDTPWGVPSWVLQVHTLLGTSDRSAFQAGHTGLKQSILLMIPLSGPWAFRGASLCQGVTSPLHDIQKGFSLHMMHSCSQVREHHMLLFCLCWNLFPLVPLFSDTHSVLCGLFKLSGWYQFLYLTNFKGQAFLLNTLLLGFDREGRTTFSYPILGSLCARMLSLFVWVWREGGG